MNINIIWVDNENGIETVEHLQTPACAIRVHRRGDVISQINWDFNEHNNSSKTLKTLDFWPEPDNEMTVKLLKQGTSHQNKVWSELLKIPLGTTLTYSDIAKRIGSSPRAVGNACRDNPYTLLIPCHRVVSVNGMGGYSGQRHGEYMKIKAKLLEFEARHVAEQSETGYNYKANAISQEELEKAFARINAAAAKAATL